MKCLVAALVVTLVCLGSSPKLAVYPGLVVDEQVSKSIRTWRPNEGCRERRHCTTDEFRGF